jgi:hypothetical protein
MTHTADVFWFTTWAMEDHSNSPIWDMLSASTKKAIVREFTGLFLEFFEKDPEQTPKYFWLVYNVVSPKMFSMDGLSDRAQDHLVRKLIHSLPEKYILQEDK